MEAHLNIRWLKLDVSLFSDHKIKRIRRMVGGDQMLIVWIGVLCCAMKSKRPGYLLIDEKIPMTSDDLSDELDIPKEVVEAAIKSFIELEMLTIHDNGTAEVKNFSAHQELDAIEHFRKKSAERVRRHREKRLLLLENSKESNPNDETLCNVTETLGNANKTEIETEIEIKKEEDTEAKSPLHEVAVIWNEKADPIFSKVMSTTDDRKRKIRLRLSEGMKIDEIIAKMNVSPFLRGEKSEGWKASFDWVIANSGNWVKVMEGNYDPRGTISKDLPKEVIDQNSKKSPPLPHESLRAIYDEEMTKWKDEGRAVSGTIKRIWQ